MASIVSEQTALQQSQEFHKWLSQYTCFFLSWKTTWVIIWGILLCMVLRKVRWSDKYEYVFLKKSLGMESWVIWCVIFKVVDLVIFNTVATVFSEFLF